MQQGDGLGGGASRFGEVVAERAEDGAQQGAGRPLLMILPQEAGKLLPRVGCLRQGQVYQQPERLAGAEAHYLLAAADRRSTQHHQLEHGGSGNHGD